MGPANTHNGNGRQAPETLSRSSSITAVSPIVRDGVDEIMNKLAKIDDIIGDLDTRCSKDTTRVPDVGDLLQDISILQDEIRGTKLAQDAQIKKINDEVKNDVKKEIAKILKNEISVIIADSVAAEVREEVADWGNKPGVPKLVSGLRKVLQENDVLLANGKILLENSYARHANATIDIQDDFNTPLKQIKHKDGYVSELFPTNLRDLFSYDAAQLTRLLKEYDLRPFEKHSENLNRFLTFIGVNASVPDQMVDLVVEEQLPAYPHRDTAGLRDEMIQRSTRRRSSASEKSANSSWYGGIFG